MCVIVPAVVAFIAFYVWFYTNLIKLKYDESERDIREVQQTLYYLQDYSPQISIPDEKHEDDHLDA